jgi:PadR family transcriptional regulator, regulatory protein PadR
MIKKFRKELNSGTVSLIILAVLDQAQEPMYGYHIAKSLERLGHDGEPAVKQGTLYPVLRSMERSGLLSSEVEPSVAGPPRKYYVITDDGRGVLLEWKQVWTQTRDFVEEVLAGRIQIDRKELGNEIE